MKFILHICAVVSFAYSMPTFHLDLGSMAAGEIVGNGISL